MNALLERYAMGRLLYRLAKSDRRNEFVLKGAQLFRVWEAVPNRPTRDLDLLGLEEGSEDSIETLFTQLVRLPVQPVDGLQWGRSGRSRYGTTRRMEAFGPLCPPCWRERGFRFGSTWGSEM